jgi:hypothetical protein
MMDIMEMQNVLNTQADLVQTTYQATTYQSIKFFQRDKNQLSEKRVE